MAVRISRVGTYTDALNGIKRLDANAFGDTTGLSRLKNSFEGVANVIDDVDDVSDAAKSNVLQALGTALNSFDSKNLKKIMTALDEAGVAHKILGDIPIEDSAKILNKLSDTDANKILAKMPEGKASEIAAKMGRKWDVATKTLVVGAGIATAAFFEKKLRDAEEKIKNCVDACLPEGWDAHKEGTLEKSKLKFSDVVGTRDQPICKKEMNDCGEYCDSKCKSEHTYKPPFSKLPGAAADAGKDTLQNFFNNLNPFNKDGIFGNNGWVSLVCCVLIIFGIGALAMLKK